MQESSEQNKTEDATPFKLKRAREKGVIARGVDLGFFSSLSAFTAFASISGAALMQQLSIDMGRLYINIADIGADTNTLAGVLGPFWSAFQMIALLGATIFVVVVTFEIIQARGVVFTTQPLKPDFNRLNPAKGLKRLFSLRMLKETAKNVLKLCLYSAATYLAVTQALQGTFITDATSLIAALHDRGAHLAFSFLFLALVFAALDQIVARGEFAKQMRMSRSELTREHKEREGEPRMKRKRKQLHAEFASQTKGFGELSGADMLIVNPQHYAVALSYDSSRMSAPQVVAKGRNHFALALKQRAAAFAVPIMHHPPLARALFKACDPGDEAPAKFYRDIAALYVAIARAGKAEVAHGHA